MSNTSSEKHNPLASLVLPTVIWQLSAFAKLSGYEIYNIIQAREQVFVKDQNCSYIDADGVDFAALHLCAYKQQTTSSLNNSLNNSLKTDSLKTDSSTTNNSDNISLNNSKQNLDQQLLAYCRIIPPTTTADGYPHIGRVLVLADYRGHGLARQLMLRALKYCHSQFADQPIHISAQTYLIEFYQSLGFVCMGDAYSNDGIEHVNMVLVA